VDKFGLSSTRTRSLLGHADADKTVYSYSGTHYPRWRTCRWQGRIGARGASPQSSILRYGIDTLPSVDPGVNYSLKLYFILAGRLVTQRAM
jgi:hypothetical protein